MNCPLCLHKKLNDNSLFSNKHYISSATLDNTPYKTLNNKNIGGGDYRYNLNSVQKLWICL